MATHSTPHFHNQPGVPQVRVSAKEFMCVGALPPFDHPHIFIMPMTRRCTGAACRPIVFSIRVAMPETSQHGAEPPRSSK
jgi:uncharacterized Zn-finger protein